MHDGDQRMSAVWQMGWRDMSGLSLIGGYPRHCFRRAAGCCDTRNTRVGAEQNVVVGSPTESLWHKLAVGPAMNHLRVATTDGDLGQTDFVDHPKPLPIRGKHPVLCIPPVDYAARIQAV